MKFTPLTSASAFLNRSRQSYQQIPDNEDTEEDQGRVSSQERDENHALIHTKLWTLQLNKNRKLVLGILFVIFIAIAVYVGFFIFNRLPQGSCDSTLHGYTCRPELSHNWGQYSPYFSVPSSISPLLPTGCHLTFAQVLSRHGARDPTWSKSLRYSALIARIHTYAESYSRPFSFIKDYEYTLGSDQLSAFGQQQMINSGASFYARYQDLTRKQTPFIRASGQRRVIISAQNFTQGFHSSRLDDEQATGEEEYPYPILIIPESTDFNNTLDFTLCTNFLKGPFGENQQTEFASTFIPAITTRFNNGIPGVNFTDSDIISLMDLCPFETVASPSGQLSLFCDLFTISDWQNYDYYESLGKYYGFEWGNPLAPSQGVGFVNELIARLTGRPVTDHTSTNTTLDADETTFPLYNGKGVYADFSHDNDMTTMFAALGLYNETKPLPSNAWNDRDGDILRGYSAAYTVPFGARLYVEKMVCGRRDEEGWELVGKDGNVAEAEQDEEEEDGEEFVRVIVNDRVLPLKTCGGDELGRCTLRKFVESLSYARGGGDWDKCFS